MFSAGDSQSSLPEGNLTFLFTDVEGSTARWEREPALMRKSLARLEEATRTQVTAGGGWVVKGTGDGLLAVFTSADAALEAALLIQLDVQPSGLPPLRIALHTGEAEQRGGDYYGPALNRCHRVLEAGHGGQILLTSAVVEALQEKLPEGSELVGLGRHRLRAISEAVEILQLSHIALRTQFPRLITEDEGANNLPADLTGFIGRAAELDEGAAMLAASRLVTLIGGGGSGKSRLALKLAEGQLEHFVDGVWLVELAPLTDGTLIAKQMAQVLGIPEEPGSSWLSSMGSRLRQQQVLLVLDNCEHLLGAAAETTDQLLRRCPNLKVLATSRHKLGVPGEAAFVVPPMSVPSVDDLASPSAVARHDSVRLFEQRATEADPSFGLDEMNAAAVGEICRAVDGIPLAVELAAGKVGTLSVWEVAERLQRHLLDLGGGSRTGPARHRTMQATLDWSNELLEEDERSLLAQLSIFSGGFDARASEEVCRVDGTVLETLGALADKSLVLRLPATSRFRLLEPVRLYAADKLVQRSGHEQAAARHAAYYAGFVEAGAAGLPAGGQGLVWLDLMEADHDNIRAALKWTLENDEVVLALRLAAGSWEFWRLRGHLTEGRQWLDRVIGASSDPPAELLASALLGAGALAGNQGDDASAELALQRALESYRQLGNDVEAAAATRRLAAIPHRRGDLRQAASRFEEALDLAGKGGDLVQMGQIQASLALLYEDLGRPDMAMQTAQAALDTARQADDPYVRADALLSLAELALNRADLEEAENALDQVDLLAGREGFQDVIAWARGYGGKLALASGEPGRAVLSFEQALAAFQAQGQPVGTVWALRHLARAALVSEDPERATNLFRSALEQALVHVVPEAPLALLGLAEAAVARGETETGLVLLTASTAAADRMGLVLHREEREAAVRAENVIRWAVDPARVEELAEQGRSMRLAEASAYAFEPPSSSSL